MTLTIIGDHPFARNAQGGLKSGIATVFPGEASVLITLPGIHAMQRDAYVAFLNRERGARGLAALTPEEEEAVRQRAVDLIVKEERLLIRPGSGPMELLFEGDEALQQLLPKEKIGFLYTAVEAVRQAIRERGEYWRIAAPPQSTDEIRKMILDARIRITHGDIYRYNALTGTRYLTFAEFAGLGKLDAAALAAQLHEIGEFAQRRNSRYNPEVAFFAVGPGFGSADFMPCDLTALAEAELRRRHAELTERFRQATPVECQTDDTENPPWRQGMFTALAGSGGSDAPAEQLIGGLSPEFFLQVKWLPGARTKNGQLVFDSIFGDLKNRPDDAGLKKLCDLRARRFIVNFIRELGEVEYVNVGRVVDSLSRRKEKEEPPGCRGVYIAEIKAAGMPAPLVRIIRMQKWGILEHLEMGKDLMQAILEAEEYTDYVLDRRLGCRQLGMNLPSRVVSRKFSGKYDGPRAEYRGILLWSTYFERDYIHGVSTDQIQKSRFKDRDYALALARLLGAAAAPNMIVGRTTDKGTVLFDDGDELLIEDASGQPVAIVVADHTGTFAGFRQELEAFAPAYAQPVTARLELVPCPEEFAQAYLDAFRLAFLRIQAEYRRRRRTFDTLFEHCEPDARGNFADRWAAVLKRLDRSDADRLTAAIAQHVERSK